MSLSAKWKAIFKNIFCMCWLAFTCQIFLDNVDPSWKTRSELGMTDFKRTPSVGGTACWWFYLIISIDSEAITPEPSLPTPRGFHHDLKALNKYSESKNYHDLSGKFWFNGGGQGEETWKKQLICVHQAHENKGEPWKVLSINFVYIPPIFLLRNPNENKFSKKNQIICKF